MSFYQLALLFTAALTLALTIIAHFNYPGGVAMQRLADLTQHERDATVHLDAFSAMTGASLFTHPSSLHVNKSESLTSPSDFAAFDYLVTHEPSPHTANFDIIAEISSFTGLRQRRWPTADSLLDRCLQLSPVSPVFEPTVFIMRKSSSV